MTVIVIIDSLRWDVATDDDIMENLNSFQTVEPVWANNNVTESSLMTILSGDHPLQHGICGLIQGDSERIVQNNVSLDNWSMFSPAVLFERGDAVGKFSQGKYYDEIDQKLFDAEVSVFHVMDVHDYKDRGDWTNFYEGFEPLPETRVEEQISKMDAWHVPWEDRNDIDNDAGKLKAMYKSAASNVDEWLGKVKKKCEKENRRLIVTADHGECFGEMEPYPQPVFRHVSLWDSVLTVPLAVDDPVTLRRHTDHTDIQKVVQGLSEVGNRSKVISVEHSWQTGVRITSGESCFITWRENVFNYPNEIGDETLQEEANKYLDKMPDGKPSMWEFNSDPFASTIENILDKFKNE